MKVELTREEMASLAVLKSAGEDLMEVAIIAKEAMEAGRGKLKRARKCIAAGVEELKKQERTVTFEKAVAFALEARRERRVRTVYDFRYFTRRFMKRCPGLARRKGRAISAQEIKDLRQTAARSYSPLFPSQRQAHSLTFAIGVRGNPPQRPCGFVAGSDWRNCASGFCISVHACRPPFDCVPRGGGACPSYAACSTGRNGDATPCASPQDDAHAHSNAAPFRN